MKNKLFGRLGNHIRGNWLVCLLLLAVAGAGVFSYTTITNINRRLENQKLQDVETTPSPAPEQEIQDVQTEQENVPFASVPTASPQKSPRQDVQTQPRPTAEPVQTETGFVLPVAGKIYAAFSGDELVYNRTLDDWRTHNGIDITAPHNDPVKAGASGTVKAVYEDGMLGTVIEIDHGGYIARYCGLNRKTFVKEGDSVSRGTTIGSVGEITMEVAEESHIHLEIIENGKAVNPDKLLK